MGKKIILITVLSVLVIFGIWRFVAGRDKPLSDNGQEEVIVRDLNHEQGIDSEELTGSEPEESPYIRDTYLEVDPKEYVDLTNYNNEAAIRLDRKVAIGFFGIDQRVTDYGRSDVIMLLVYDNHTETVTMISVPRDTRVTIPGYFDDKINHAYAYGGEALASATLEALFEVKLDYYFVADFDDFEHIIDLFGGVMVDAKKDFAYDGQVLIESGNQVLSGEEALIYVRFRSDAQGDYGRIQRQQEVLSSLGSQIGQYDEGELTDLFNEIYYDYLDTDMAMNEMIGYAMESHGDYPVELYTLSTTSKVIDGIWYELIDQADLDRLRGLVRKDD